MKKQTLIKIAGAIVIPALTTLSGCMSDTGFAVDVLKVKLGHQGALGTPREAVAETSRGLFKRDCQPYDKSEISNGAVQSASPVWKHYKTRNQESK